MKLHPPKADARNAPFVFNISGQMGGIEEERQVRIESLASNQRSGSRVNDLEDGVVVAVVVGHALRGRPIRTPHFLER
jgi:hypothetical protein